MVKAVATALVLIAGAAVVLWFGNTLNSWVLGGLIGGLAALLLSIPISLILFSYITRQHEEKLRAEAELSQAYEYEQIPVRAIRGSYELEEYPETEGDEEFWREDEQYYQPPRQQMRVLPPPAPQPRLPEKSPSLNNLQAPRRGTYAPLPRPGTKSTHAARGEDAPTRRATTRPINPSGFPGYEPGTVLRQQRSAALRAARKEKLQQYDDDVEVLPTNMSHRLPTVRPQQDRSDQYEQIQRPRSSRQFQSDNPGLQRRPPVAESKLSRSDLSRVLPPERSSTIRQSSYQDDPETEGLEDFYPETGPVHYPTGQIARNPRLDGQFSQADTPSGSLKRPLVRRAPYTYDDDPIRQELSQQLPSPKIRRSSRLEPEEYDQE